MNGLKTNVLSVGLGGIAAVSLLMTGGQAHAQAACPTDTVIGTVLVPGFSCTLGDKTFSDFTILARLRRRWWERFSETTGLSLITRRTPTPLLRARCSRRGSRRAPRDTGGRRQRGWEAGREWGRGSAGIRDPNCKENRHWRDPTPQL